MHKKGISADIFCCVTWILNQLKTNAVKNDEIHTDIRKYERGHWRKTKLPTSLATEGRLRERWAPSCVGQRREMSPQPNCRQGGSLRPFYWDLPRQTRYGKPSNGSANCHCWIWHTVLCLFSLVCSRVFKGQFINCVRCFGFSFLGCWQEYHQVAEGERSPRQCQQFQT